MRKFAILAILLLSALPALGEVIIVGDDEPVTVRGLVDEIARLTGARPPRSVPLGLLSAAGLAAEIAFKPLGKEPPISRRTLRFFTANTAFNVTKARRLLGHRPQYNLASGLAETKKLLSFSWPLILTETLGNIKQFANYHIKKTHKAVISQLI